MSVERLSEKMACAIDECVEAWSQVEEDIIKAGIARLAAYEDTGKTPEEVLAMAKKLAELQAFVQNWHEEEKR